jgi:hypothetical protein
MPPNGGIFQKPLFLVLALALLIGNATAGLAGRLAGSLALAATAVLGTGTKIFGLDGLNTLHDDASVTYKSDSLYHIWPIISSTERNFLPKFLRKREE